MLTKKELVTLRKSLPKGGYMKIAELTGYDYSMVGKVLRDPKHFNQIIIDGALQVIEAYRKEVAELKAKVQSLSHE